MDRKLYSVTCMDGNGCFIGFGSCQDGFLIKFPALVAKGTGVKHCYVDDLDKVFEAIKLQQAGCDDEWIMYESQHGRCLSLRCSNYGDGLDFEFTWVPRGKDVGIVSQNVQLTWDQLSHLPRLAEDYYSTPPEANMTPVFGLS